MKLGEALSKLKKEKSGLARMIELRKENVLLPVDEKPSFNPEKLTLKINKKIVEIRKLKLSIQKTNMTQKIKNTNQLISEAIIKINDFRSILSSLRNLFYRKPSLFHREKDDVKMVAHLKETAIEEEIKKIQSEKTKLDDLLQITNWSTELIN